MSATAFGTSAVRSTIAGTLPGPTPYAGFPELYAERTIAAPPVARITEVSRWRISSVVPSAVGTSRMVTRSSGAPASAAARCNTSTAATEHRAARGWGENTMAFRAFTAISAL